MDIVIVGGGYAGLMAAGRLGRLGAGHRVRLVDATGVMVQRTRLHQVAAGRAVRHVDLRAALSPLDVELVVGRAVGIDGHRLVLEDGSKVSFDRLLLTTGSRMTRPPAFASAHRLDDPGTAARLGEAVRAAAMVTVVGGGLTGLELASELALRRARGSVRLVTAGEVGADLCLGAARWVRRRLEKLGVQVVERAWVDSVEPGSVVVDGERLDSDHTVWSGGMEASPWVRGLGVATDEAGRLRVDATLAVPGLPGVLAAGDAAAVARRPWLRMSCAAAMPMGAHAADNLRREIRGEAQMPLDLGLVLRCIGLGGPTGLVQLSDSRDRPVRRWWAGLHGGVIKEAILAMTVHLPALERRLGRPLYAWPGAGSEVELRTSAVGR